MYILEIPTPADTYEFNYKTLQKGCKVFSKDLVGLYVSVHIQYKIDYLKFGTMWQTNT